MENDGRTCDVHGTLVGQETAFEVSGLSVDEIETAVGRLGRGFDSPGLARDLDLSRG
jgi:hypothetical protein